MQITNISEAKSSLSSLIAKVEKGHKVIIGKAGKPVAMLVPYRADTTPRKLIRERGFGVGNFDQESARQTRRTRHAA